MPKKFIKSFKYARLGAQHAIKTQRNLWIHIGIAILVLGFAYMVKCDLIEFALLSLAIFPVLAAEMFNTAIEEMVNLLSPHQQPQAALVKNLAAGAVLLASVGAAVVGAIVFIPKVF